MNLAGDLAHSFANVIGNSISEADAKKNKQKLYTDDLKKVFVKAVYDVCLNMHMFVVNSLGNVEIFMGDDVMTLSDKRTASRIMENYKSLSADDNTALNMLKDAIKANPFEMDTYKELIDRFGDSDNSLVVYGSCFNIDVKYMKNNMVTLKYKRIYENIDNEDELKSKETDIRNLVNKYGLEFEETEVFHLYNTKLKELDLEYRIVDDIIFLERDEADMARNELAEIDKYMESLDEPRYMDDSYERQLIETKDK